MKISKFVEVSQDVEIEIGADDIREALADAFNTVADSSSRFVIERALNDMAKFLNALTDEQINLLTSAARVTVQKFLLRASDRFKIPAAEAVSTEQVR